MLKRRSIDIPKRVGRFSLGFKIGIGITLLIMILMFVVGVNSYLRNRAIMVEEAQSRGWITARTTSAFAADYLRGNNTTLLGNIIDHLERDPFVKRVAFLDLNGTVVMSSDSNLLNKKLDGAEIKKAIAEKTDTLKYQSDLKGHPLAMEFTSPIAARNQAPVGFFWMETDLSYITSHLVSTALNQLYTSLLAILAGLIISRFVVLRVVQRPLKELETATDRVATGDFSDQVQVFNQDELGRLSTAFNTMTGHLGILFQSVRSSVNEITQTAQVIINRSEQSDLATKKLAESLRNLQQTTAELPESAAAEQWQSLQIDETTQTTLRQQEHLREIRNASKKLVRYIDRLDSISMQFKFNEK